jgi:glutathionylspermidine synthase
VPQDIIHHYHDLLTPQLAADSQAQLAAVQKQRGLAFGERPLCTVLRPRFLTHDQYRFLCQRVGKVLRAFDKAYRAALVDAALRKQFLLSPNEEELVQHDPGFPCCSPTGRLDAFFVSDQELRFTEYNAETPAAAAYTDCLGEIFLGLPVVREFLHSYHVWPVPARSGVLHALLDSYKQWSPSRDLPRIAILDWKDVPTYSEFVLFEQYFKSHGFPCVIADPREVEYRGGKLYAGDFHITLIYKRVLIGELLQKGGLNHPVVRAVRENAVCMVNPFRCKILYKKASFAVLSDERNAHLFDAGDQEAIAAHIPWTRVVAERKTTRRGQTIDLIPYLHQHRKQLVLKPNDDYGGRGIFLGWTVDAAT